MLTSSVEVPVGVQDLSITLPLCAIGRVLLWRPRSWGYLLAGALPTMLVIESASVATDQVFGHLHGPGAFRGAVPPFVVLTLVGLVPAVAFLRNLTAGRSTSVR